MPTLDILIATYKPSGIEQLAAGQLPKLQGVKYVVSWQRHENAPIPQALLRPDIEIYRTDSIGLSNNRNNGLTHVSADIIFIADDDVTISSKGLQELMQAYDAHPEIDMITCKSIHDSGVTYPHVATKLSQRLPKNYYATSLELSFRRRCGLRFCPELGLNSPRMHGGEDEMLLQSAIRKGLNVWFWPITVCEHDHPSTGTKARFTPQNLRASGCVIALSFGWQAWLRVPLKAWRVARAGQASLPHALYYIAQGALEARALRRRNPDTLWP